LVLALAVTVSGPEPASAECDGPVPSFRAVAPTAERVVIGDVVAVRPRAQDGSGGSSRFTLRVRFVLRGEAPKVMEINDLSTQPCAADVIARVGDRIALAFDGIEYTPPTRVNTVAWIRGTPPSFVGVETISLARTFQILGLSVPETSTLPGPAEAAPHVLPWIVFVGLVSGLVGYRRFRPRRR